MRSKSSRTARTGHLYIGTSGWQYRDWRDVVYPGVPQREWLPRYAALFATVELNNSFYRLPSREQFERWATATPDDFCFAVKASRYLTHIKRLREPEDSVRLLLERSTGLGHKLGLMLLQLPPHLPCDVGNLDAALSAFDDVRVAVELRDERWHTDAVYDVLRAHDAALCWWDRRGRHGPLVVTSSWCYLRFHEGRATPSPSYGRQALATWCDRIVTAFGAEADAWVYFNNDPGAAAPRDAVRFAALARAHGLRTTRTPERRDLGAYAA